MSVYAVGDVQGCLGPLQQVLEKVGFSASRDRLWLTGDLVNRGPDSLGVLRFVMSLSDAALTVLGNHDLHFLAVAMGARPMRNKDVLSTLLAAPDCDELVAWLRQRPLVHHDRDLGFTLVHAGIPPQWDVPTALERAAEVEQMLRGDEPKRLLATMYGNEPSAWSDGLLDEARWRVITNYFTRMRFCSAHGELDLQAKHEPEAAPPGMAPWFHHPERKAKHERIIFGHWATLRGRANTPNVFALDTGCVYGGQLTLLELQTQRSVCVSCPRYDPPAHPKP